MILAVDIEQQISYALKSNNFFFGTIYGKDGKVNFTIDNKKLFWEKVIELALKEAKQKRNTYVYGHNHYFDFLQYAKLTDSNNTYRSISPFIFEREFSNKEKLENGIDKKANFKIYFLDSFSLYKGALKKMGSLIRYEKLEWDFEDKKKIKVIEKEIEKKGINSKELSKEATIFKDYNIRDAVIVYKFILFLKKELEKQDFKPKRLVTITMLSRNYYFKKIRQLEENDFFGKLEVKESKKGYKYIQSMIFANRNKNEVYKPVISIMEKQALAGRGGRFEAFKIGNFEDCIKIDLNSAYTKAMDIIKIPNFKTHEGIIYNPDKYFNSKKRLYLQKLGVALVHLYKKDKSCVGIVPIRYRFEGQNHQIFPNNKDVNLIGSYTHTEINYFVNNGFELKNVFYTTYYSKTLKNPFPIINKKLYQLRDKNKFWNYFAKALMNYFTGSTKQNREYVEKKVDDRCKVQEYMKKGWTVACGFGEKFLYEKGKGVKVYSKSFMGQIYAEITANIRIKITDVLKMIGEENVIYVPCDAIIFTEKRYQQIKDKINISKKVGDFKLEYRHEKGCIFSKQQYFIEDEIRLSGVTKNVIKKNKENIKNKRTIKTKKMVSMFQSYDKAGSFVEEERNFEKSLIKANKLIDEIKERNLFIDELDYKVSYKVINEYLEKNKI